MKPTIFQKEAKEEFESAIEYYEKQRKGLGLEFQAEIEKAVARIEKNPKCCGFYKNSEYRKCVVKRFPYVLFYLELDSAVWLMAVYHSKRRPDVWIERPQES